MKEPRNKRRFTYNFPLGLLVGFSVAMVVTYFVTDSPVTIGLGEGLTLTLILTTLAISAISTSVSLTEIDNIAQRNLELDEQNMARRDRKDSATSALLSLHLGRLRHYIGRTLQIADEVNKTNGEYFSSREMVFKVFEELSPPKDILESISQSIEISNDELQRQYLIQLLSSIEVGQSNLRDHCLSQLREKRSLQNSLMEHTLEIAPLWSACFRLTSYHGDNAHRKGERELLRVTPLNVRSALREHASSFLDIEDKFLETASRNHNKRSGLAND